MKIVVNMQSLVLDVPKLTQKDIDEGNLKEVKKAFDKWLKKNNFHIESIEEL